LLHILKRRLTDEKERVILKAHAKDLTVIVELKSWEYDTIYRTFEIETETHELGTYPVTQREGEVVMSNNPSYSFLSVLICVQNTFCMPFLLVFWAINT
jgi:hypothetical protein